MLKERRDIDSTSPTPTPTEIQQTAYDNVAQILMAARAQNQLGYSPATMEQTLPITVSYYLFWKGYKALANGDEDEKPTANKYVIAALMAYPDILDEITLEHTHRRPLDTTSPHDVALYLGVRLAEYETRYNNKITILRQLQTDAKALREIATTTDNEAA